MTDQRPPHENSTPQDDDPIIELTDVVTPSEAAGEEIIELTDVVTRADEEIIELTDVVAPGQADAPAAALADEDPIIELTDVVAPTTIEAGPAATEEDTTAIEAVFALGDDEDVDVEGSTPEATADDLAFAEMELDIDEHANEELFDSMDMNMEAELLNAKDEAGDLDFNLSTQELSDAIDLLDAKLAEEPPKEPERQTEVLEDPSALRSGDLEAALENVIRKMFGDKIDHLLDAAIEKTVSTEIARLKKQLLDDGPDKPRL